MEPMTGLLYKSVAARTLAPLETELLLRDLQSVEARLNKAKKASKRLKLIDAFLVFLMLSGVIQFAYCALITNFPFNSFIAG